MSRSLSVIVNPISGTGNRPGRASELLGSVAQILSSRGVHPNVWLTEARGHAFDLATRDIARGVETIVAWGGDGTVNEVAAALAFSPARLAIVPSGSGNGLARFLGIPLNRSRAVDVALGSHEMLIDVGELDGKRFVNAAGVGLDAAIAHRFASDGGRRGLRRYAELTLSEVFAYQSQDFTVSADGEVLRTTPLLLTLANGTQFGNGAVVAPAARADDGWLDLVIASNRRPVVALLQAPMLFLGGATRLPGVITRVVREVVITSSIPIRYHVDGEPGCGGTALRAGVHPRALRVMIPG